MVVVDSAAAAVVVVDDGRLVGGLHVVVGNVLAVVVDVRMAGQLWWVGCTCGCAYNILCVTAYM